MPWSNTSGSDFDLTHLADLGPYAPTAAPVTWQTPVLVPSVMGSTYLITVAATTVDTASVAVIVEHLDPSGNVVWSEKFPGVYATQADSVSVIRGAAFASDIRVTVGVGSFVSGGGAVGPVQLRVYSSPNQQHRPTRVVGSSLMASASTDSVLLDFTGTVLASSTAGPFALRPYAGVASVTLSTVPATIGVLLASEDTEGTTFSAQTLSSNGQISLPAGINELVITNTGATDELVVLSIIADDFTL